MSKRQDRKQQRSGQKDKNGNSLTLSRPVRRGLQRLQRARNSYESCSGKNPESGQAYTFPGAMRSY